MKKSTPPCHSLQSEMTHDGWGFWPDSVGIAVARSSATASLNSSWKDFCRRGMVHDIRGSLGKHGGHADCQLTNSTSWTRQDENRLPAVVHVRLLASAKTCTRSASLQGALLTVTKTMNHVCACCAPLQWTLGASVHHICACCTSLQMISMQHACASLGGVGVASTQHVRTCCTSLQRTLLANMLRALR